MPNASTSMLAELRARADNIRELGGDHRQEAFIVRLAEFNGGDEDMAGLASMAVNKPVRDWVDPGYRSCDCRACQHGTTVYSG